MTDIETLRNELSELDLKIIELVHRRQVLSEEIGAIKREKGRPTRDYQREKLVIELAKSHAEKLNVDPVMVVDLMQLLIQSSLKTQESARVKEEGQGNGKKVLIIGGLGRMGSWFAEFMSMQGYEVHVADKNIDEQDESHFSNWKGTDDNYDITVIATPLRQSKEILEEILEHGRQGILFDIASIKSPIKETLTKISEKGMRVTSIHPMFGPDTDLLTGKHIVFMNLDEHDTHLEIMKLFESTTAQLIEMSIDSHDYAISYVLGLSHIINIAFSKVLYDSGQKEEEFSQVSSTTFKDQIEVARRVAQENPNLYFEIQHLNDHSIKTIEELNRVIKEITDAITMGSEDNFVKIMHSGKKYFEDAEV